MMSSSSGLLDGKGGSSSSGLLECSVDSLSLTSSKVVLWMTDSLKGADVGSTLTASTVIGVGEGVLGFSDCRKMDVQVGRMEDRLMSMIPLFQSINGFILCNQGSPSMIDSLPVPVIRKRVWRRCPAMVTWFQAAWVMLPSLLRVPSTL